MRIVTLVAWIALAALTGCQTAKPPPDYATLAKAAEAGQPVSAAALRAAFMAAPDFNERLQKLTPLEQQALQMMADEPLRLGAMGSAILNIYYGSLAGHYALVEFYKRVDAPDSAAQHQAWLDKLTAAIEAGGDGSRDKPWPVVSATEAETFLRVRGLTPVGSMYHSTDAVPFMMLITARPAKGPLENHYFNLSAAYHAVEHDVAASETSGEPGEAFSPAMLIGYLARNDDSAAQAAIGAYLLSENHYRDAASWLNMASRTGNVLANLMLARVYQLEAEQLKGDEHKQAMEFVLEQYLHAIAVGSDDAMFALGGLYIDGDYGKENVQSGVALLKQAADLGNASALMWLGQLSADGTHVPKDPVAAEDYFKRAAETGDVRARIQYARYLLTLDPSHPFDPRAYQWVEEDAKKGDAESMLMLGNLYARGAGVGQSFHHATHWYKAAVDAAPDDANIVNEVAWTLAVSHFDRLREPKYALQIMDKVMNKDTEARSNPAYLDTWAAANAATGDFRRAVELQQQAVKAARDQNDKDTIEVLEQHLQSFQRNETVIDPVP
jgi:tetratricopeptide (TPR) repeat protein